MTRQTVAPASNLADLDPAPRRRRASAQDAVDIRVALTRSSLCGLYSRCPGRDRSGVAFERQGAVRDADRQVGNGRRERQMG